MNEYDFFPSYDDENVRRIEADCDEDAVTIACGIIEDEFLGEGTWKLARLERFWDSHLDDCVDEVGEFHLVESADLRVFGDGYVEVVQMVED